MRGSIVVLAVALGCEAGDSWFPESRYLFESMEGRDLAPGSRIEFRFGGETLEVYAGCKGVFGEYRLREGALVVGELYEDDSSVSCEPARNEQAAWMRRFLDGSPAYEQDRPRLILTDDLVTLALLDDEVADPDRPLVGPTWEIDGLADAGLVMGVPRGVGTITFGADGHLVIDGPCATGAAEYVAGGALLSLEQVAIDAPECPDEDAAQSTDAHLRELLVEGPLSYEIDAARLTIGGSDLGLLLRTD